EFDLLGNGDAIVRDGRCSPLLFEHDIATAGSKGHLDRVRELVESSLESPTSFFVECNHLCHSGLAPPWWSGLGNQSSRQRPRRQRVSPYVPFHIRTTLSRRLVGTHRFSPVLDLALSPCECKYSSPAVTSPAERDGSPTGYSPGAGGRPDLRLLEQVPRILGARESQHHRHDDRFGVTTSAVRPIVNAPAASASRLPVLVVESSVCDRQP